jgi:hypothetical protein
LKKNSVYIEIVLCTQCPHHRWQSNPDPDDWFRDDECDLICTYNNKANIISSSLNVFEQKNPNYTTSIVGLLTMILFARAHNCTFNIAVSPFSYVECIL